MKLEDQVRYIYEAFTSHIEEGITRDAEIMCQIETATKRMEEINDSVRGLLTVWEQTHGVLIFIKWLIGISGSILAILAYIKGVR